MLSATSSVRFETKLKVRLNLYRLLKQILNVRRATCLAALNNTRITQTVKVRIMYTLFLCYIQFYSYWEERGRRSSYLVKFSFTRFSVRMIIVSFRYFMRGDTAWKNIALTAITCTGSTNINVIRIKALGNHFLALRHHCWWSPETGWCAGCIYAALAASAWKEPQVLATRYTSLRTIVQPINTESITKQRSI